MRGHVVIRAVGFMLMGALLAAVLIAPASGHVGNRVRHLYRHMKQSFGYEVVTSVVTVGANTNEFGSVACPTGKRPIGGGVDALQSNNAHDTLLRIIESYPAGSTWQALVASERTDGSSTFTVYAICARV